MRTYRTFAAALGPKIALLWAGVSLGVSFLATPAKFLATSLSLPVALDVGRHTFHICNRVELAVCASLTVLGLWAAPRSRWVLAFFPPAFLVFVQSLWLIPALDARVAMVLAGLTPSPSPLHGLYVAVEATKFAWLATVGLSSWPWLFDLHAKIGLTRPPVAHTIFDPGS